MDATSVSASKEIVLLNEEPTDIEELPNELKEILENPAGEKISGFIHGDKYGKIVNTEVTTKHKNISHYKSIGFNEVAYDYKKGEGNKMNNNSNETLFNEIKNDMREREERLRREITEREERFEKQLISISNDALRREDRYFQEAKEREERLITALDKMESKMESNAKHTENIKTQNFWGNIALFVGMLAIVITLLFVI